MFNLSAIYFLFLIFITLPLSIRAASLENLSPTEIESIIINYHPYHRGIKELHLKSKCTSKKRAREKECKLIPVEEDNPKRLVELKELIESQELYSLPNFKDSKVGKLYSELVQFLKVYGQIENCHSSNRSYGGRLNKLTNDVQISMDSFLNVGSCGIKSRDSVLDRSDQKLLGDLIKKLDTSSSVQSAIDLDSQVLKNNLKLSIQAFAHFEDNSKVNPEKLLSRLCRKDKKTYCSQMQENAVQSVLDEMLNDPTLLKSIHDERGFKQENVNLILEELNKPLVEFNKQKEKLEKKLHETMSKLPSNRRANRSIGMRNTFRDALKKLKKVAYHEYKKAAAKIKSSSLGELLNTETIAEHTGMKSLEEMEPIFFGIGGYEKKVVHDFKMDIPILKKVDSITLEKARTEALSRSRKQVLETLKSIDAHNDAVEKVSSLIVEGKTTAEVEDTFLELRGDEIKDSFMYSPQAVGKTLKDRPELMKYACKLLTEIASTEEAKDIARKATYLVVGVGLTTASILTAGGALPVAAMGAALTASITFTAADVGYNRYLANEAALDEQVLISNILIRNGTTSTQEKLVESWKEIQEGNHQSKLAFGMGLFDLLGIPQVVKAGNFIKLSKAVPGIDLDIVENAKLINRIAKNGEQIQAVRKLLHKFPAAEVSRILTSIAKIKDPKKQKEALRLLVQTAGQKGTKLSILFKFIQSQEQDENIQVADRTNVRDVTTLKKLDSGKEPPRKWEGIFNYYRFEKDLGDVIEDNFNRGIEKNTRRFEGFKKNNNITSHRIPEAGEVLELETNTGKMFKAFDVEASKELYRMNFLNNSIRNSDFKHLGVPDLILDRQTGTSDIFVNIEGKRPFDIGENEVHHLDRLKLALTELKEFSLYTGLDLDVSLDNFVLTSDGRWNIIDTRPVKNDVAVKSSQINPTLYLESFGSLVGRSLSVENDFQKILNWVSSIGKIEEEDIRKLNAHLNRSDLSPDLKRMLIQNLSSENQARLIARRINSELDLGIDDFILKQIDDVNLGDRELGQILNEVSKFSSMNDYFKFLSGLSSQLGKPLVYFNDDLVMPLRYLSLKSKNTLNAHIVDKFTGLSVNERIKLWMANTELTSPTKLLLTSEDALEIAADKNLLNSLKEYKNIEVYITDELSQGVTPFNLMKEGEIRRQIENYDINLTSHSQEVLERSLGQGEDGIKIRPLYYDPLARTPVYPVSTQPTQRRTISDGQFVERVSGRKVDEDEFVEYVKNREISDDLLTLGVEHLYFENFQRTAQRVGELLGDVEKYKKANGILESTFYYVPGGVRKSDALFAKLLQDTYGVKEEQIIFTNTEMKQRIQDGEVAGAVIVVIDDFVGSGTQMGDNIKDLSSIQNKVEKPAHIVGLAPVVAQAGKKALHDAGITIFNSIELSNIHTSGTGSYLQRQSDYVFSPGFGRGSLAIGFEYMSPDYNLSGAQQFMYYWTESNGIK